MELVSSGTRVIDPGLFLNRPRVISTVYTSSLLTQFTCIPPTIWRKLNEDVFDPVKDCQHPSPPDEAEVKENLLEYRSLSNICFFTCEQLLKFQVGQLCYYL